MLRLKETEIGFAKYGAEALSLLNSHLYLNSRFSWPVRERRMLIILDSQEEMHSATGCITFDWPFIDIPPSIVNPGLRSHDGAQPQRKYEQAVIEGFNYFYSCSMSYMGARLPLYQPGVDINMY